jgi:hypothetical protein
MKTEELIADLSNRLEPRHPAAAWARLILGLAFGLATTLALLLALWGWPLEAVRQTGVPAFTMKLGFAAAMLGIGAVLANIAGRPGLRVKGRIAWLAAPLLIVGVAALVELISLPAELRLSAWLGTTWNTCLVSVTLASVPVLTGIIWGFRHLAPTKLRLAGFLAGIAAGGGSAVLYALYCPETTAAFLVSWYTLGILAAGVIGAVAAPRFIRW